MARSHPVDELDADLERPLHVAHEIVLIDAQELEEIADRRDRGFADADRAALFRLDEPDRRPPAAQEPAQRRGGHPAGRAAADDDDALDAAGGRVPRHRAVSSRNAATHTSGAFQLIATSFREYARKSSLQQAWGAQPCATSARATSSAGLAAFGPPDRTPGGGGGKRGPADGAQKR